MPPSKTSASILRRMHALILGTAAISLLAASPSIQAANKSKLGVYDHGKPVAGLSCANPLPAQTAALMGGGKDVEAAFAWMIEQSRQCADGASARPGNFVVLRAGGNPAYDSFIYKLGELAAVQTLVVPTREAAESPELDEYIRNASAIFMTGGDQGDYYTFWHGTRLARLVSEQIAASRIPVGGTSAGMMMLSEYNYVAIPYGVTSAAALANPYATDYMAIVNDFWSGASQTLMRTPLPGLENTITDSHFAPRNRMGRLASFLARIMAADAGSFYQGAPVAVKAARAIGVDAETALLLRYSEERRSVSFTGTTVTNAGIAGHAYILQPILAPQCASGESFMASCGSVPGQFNFPAIDVFRLSHGSTFDFRSPYVNSLGSIQQYRVGIQNNVLTGNSDGADGLY